MSSRKKELYEYFPGLIRLSFPKEYGNLHVAGKVVLDVGGFVGDTCEFFLSKGAKHVIVYESEQEYQMIIQQKYGSDQQVTILGSWNGELFPAADILKMDIEGAEQRLSAEHLLHVKEFSIGLHPDKLTPDEFTRLKNLIQQFGGEEVYHEGGEIVFNKITSDESSECIWL